MRLLGSLLIASMLAAEGVPQTSRVPVVVELFTSEGCSSCPSADDLLRRLLQEQPVPGVEVIALSEHVDYWNQLGWKDPFSSSRFTSRQELYSVQFDGNGMYTPQAVVDGRFQMIGSDAPKLRDAILAAAKAPKAAVELKVQVSAGERVVVAVEVRTVPADQRADVDVMLAIVENGLAVDVRRGENASRHLRHDAVARTLERVGTLKRDTRSGTFTADVKLSPDWIRSNLKAVVFLQSKRNGHIVGAGAASLVVRQP